MLILHYHFRKTKLACLACCGFTCVQMGGSTDCCVITTTYKYPLTSIWSLWVCFCLEQHSTKNKLILELDIQLEGFLERKLVFGLYNLFLLIFKVPFVNSPKHLSTSQGRTEKGADSSGGTKNLVWNRCLYQVLAMIGTIYYTK